MKKTMITLALGLVTALAMTARDESPLLPCTHEELIDAWSMTFLEYAQDDSADRYIVRDVDGDGIEEIVVMGDEHNFLAVFRPTDEGLLMLGNVMDGYDDLGFAPGGWAFMRHDFHDGPEKRTIWTSCTHDVDGQIVTEGFAQVVYHTEEGTEEGEYSLNNENVTTQEYYSVVPLEEDVIWCSELTGWRRTIDNEIIEDPYAAFEMNSLDVFLWDDGPTNLRNAPKGKIAVTLPYGDEYIYTLIVGECVNGWLKVLYVGALDKELPFRMIDFDELWIHYSVIGTGTRNYGGQTLYLYDEPDENSSVNYSFKEEIVLHPIETDVDGWVKVKTLDGKHEGWIQTEWLCGNPVTNCC